MLKVVHFLLYKILWLICQIWLVLDSLVNGFIRYVYIPIFHSNLNSAKIIKDLSNMAKKPTQQLTFVFEIRASRTADIQTSASKMVRYGRIVEEAINPTSLNCYIDTTFINKQEEQELQQILSRVLKEERSNIKVLFQKDFNFRQKISCERFEQTPLVIVFSSYPSILGLHPNYLIGAQIAFRPQLLKATDYDLYSSLQGYASSEQRKGK